MKLKRQYTCYLINKILIYHWPSLSVWYNLRTSAPEQKALPLPFKAFNIETQTQQNDQYP